MNDPLRTRPPARRRAVTQTITAAGITLHATVGLLPTGRAIEIFLRALRPASDIDLVADDVGVLASLLLQSGYTAADLRQRLGTIANGSASSVVGLALQLAADVETEAMR